MLESVITYAIFKDSIAIPTVGKILGFGKPQEAVFICPVCGEENVFDIVGAELVKKCIHIFTIKIDITYIFNNGG